jgi:hypothetical protein
MKYKTDNLAGRVVGCYCLVWLLCGVAVSFWTDRNLDFWVSHFKGQEVDVPFWLSATFSIILSGPAVVLNAIAEIARYAL